MIPMFLNSLAPYLFLIITFLYSNGFVGGYAVLAALIFFLVVSFFGMAYAFILQRLGYDAEKLLFWNMLIKLLHIPFYLFVFFCTLLLFIMIIPLIPLVMVFEYIMLLSSTAFGISAAILLMRHDKRYSAVTIVLTVFQFVFCLDVIASVVGYIIVRRSNRKKKEA